MQKIIYYFILCFVVSLPSFSQSVINLTSKNGVSYIPCKLNGLLFEFIFDTGASEVSISLTEANFMLKNGYLKREDILGTNDYKDANGTISEGIVINLKEIQIGEFKLYNVRASIVKNLNAPLLLGQSAINKLGTINLDLKNNKLTIFNSKNKVIDINDDNDQTYSAKYWFNRGFQESTTSKKIECYSNAIALNPLFYEAYNNRGNARKKNGFYQEAIIDYTSSIKIKPENTKAYFNRAETYYYLENFVSALADCNTMISISLIKDSTFFNLRGYTNNKLKLYNSAIEDFNIAIKINPKYAYAYYGRSIAYDSLGIVVDALNDKNKAELLKPNTYKNYITKTHFAIIDGYRLLVYYGKSMKMAFDIKKKILSEFPEIKTYLRIDEPYFSLKFGNFENRDEAIDYIKILKLKLSLNNNIDVLAEKINVLK